MKPFEIFRAGRHTPVSGETIAFSEADLSACAAAYNPGLHEAPLVCGHPTVDAPAYGWVERLEARDGVLVASPVKVDPAFAELVQAGRYRKVSASFYRPAAAGNPTPGVWSLRHVGFLGATPPAVRGLKPISFSAETDGVVMFAGGEDGAEFAELQRRLKVHEERELKGFLDGLTHEGRLTPGMRNLGVAAFMQSLDDADTVSFAEGREDAAMLGQREWFRRWLKSMPVQIIFREIVTGEDFAESGNANLPAGVTLDADSLQLHRAALAYQAAHKCSYEAAVLAVAKKS